MDITRPLSNDQIREDFDAARERIETGRVLGDEDMSWHFRCAEALYWELKQRFDFEDFGSANKPDSIATKRHAQVDRTVVRVVRRPGNQIEVLKCETQFVAGASEHEILKAWEPYQLDCPRSHFGGMEEVNVHGLWNRVEFSFMDFLDGKPLSSNRPSDNNRDHQMDVLQLLTKLIKPFHFSGAVLLRRFSWADIWFQHLSAASRYLQSDHPDLEWHPPAKSYDLWREEIESRSEGDVLLHGNCRGSNVLVSNGEHVLHAPLGGIRARREWDLGMSCALEISEPQDLPVTLELVMAADRSNTALDFESLRYAAGCIAVFRASNSATTGVNETERSPIRTKEWVSVANWALANPSNPTSK